MTGEIFSAKSAAAIMDTNTYERGLRSMDEMKIESKFMTGIASRFIKKAVCNKLGCDMDIQLNGFRTTVLDDKTHVHLDVDLELTKDELNKLMKSIGL